MSDTPASPSAGVGPTVAIIGALGMLGRAWREHLDALGITHLDLDLPAIDITDAKSIAEAIPETTEVIVNCAAYTNVDKAEEDGPTALLVNGDAVGLLANHAKAISALLVHYSTDYVFDGQATSPYTADQKRDPLNAYGRTKAAGEEQIESCRAVRHLIVRTSWLYAPWANNFVLTMRKLTGEKDTLKVVDDQRGRPTSAQHLAATTWSLVKKGAQGIYHVTDGGQCTWYELTCEINRLTGHDCDVQPCTSDEFPRPAKRPAYSVLDLSKVEGKLGPMPDWRDNVKAVLDQAGEE